MRFTAKLTLLFVLLTAPVVLVGQRRLPVPESVFGFRPGADYKLATYDHVVEYMKQVASATKYVKLVEAGKTSQGRTMYFALVSSPDNLSKIDRYREIARRLAHPQGLTEREARQLARDGKALVHIDGGLHSTEVAGGQHVPLLLHDLVSRANDADVKPILDNVVVMLWPTINPDGQQMVAEWYMQNVGTPYELSGLPRLYQDYVGHDNNRDAYMLNMVESRTLEHAWRQWEPQIIYVHHQAGPFPTRVWLPPFSEPVGTDAPALMAREVNMIGMAIAKGLEERGQVGATHMGTAFDAWYPGYVDYAPNFKNIAAFWTETALFQYATPREYTISDFPQNMRDLRPQSLYSSPWPPGWWRLGDAVAYMETASFAVLEYAAKYKDSLLLNRYKAGRDQTALGATKAPFAYFVPQQQRDPVAAVELLRRLAFGGVRVSQLTASVTIGAEAFPAGTWVVPTDQEFAALAREVLDLQKYPDLRQYPGGPPERPYDAAGWTLPLQMGVRVVAATSPLGDDVRGKLKMIGSMPEPKVRPTPYEPAMTRDAAPFDSVPGAGFDTDAAAAAIVPPPGRATGTGAILLVDPAQNNAFRALNRAWAQGATVQMVGGRYAISGLSEGAQHDLVTSLALKAERSTAVASGFSRTIKKPRLGVFEPWTGSMDAGWTRWVLEQYGFAFVTVRPEDFKSPLGNKIDVLVLADDVRVPIAGGASTGFGRGGGRAVRPEHAYQLTADDLQRFDEFVRGGGTVVCLGNASTFAIQHLKLPVRNAVAGLRPEEFFLRGSIVEVTTDASHPVMAGMPDNAPVFVDSGPVFETADGFKGTVLARYQDSGRPLLSGYLIGERHLNGRAAALDVPLDAGHVVLLGFRPQWRGQPFGTFRVLFNAVLSGRAHPTPTDRNVDAAGLTLHIRCAGERDAGSPLVVLEAGAGNGAQTWRDVQGPIAAFARACAYDRPGTGTSEAAGKQLAPRVVETLHALLQAAGEPPPYVMVGHSYGGMIVRLYASRYPADVAGLVFVDSSHEDQLKRFAAVPPPARPAASAPPAMREQIDLEGMSAELAQSPWRASIPIIVLTGVRPAPGIANDPNAEARRQIWMEMHQELATRSPRSEHVVARQSGHYIQNDEPQLVIDAVRRVAAAAPPVR